MYDHVFRQRFAITFWKKERGRYIVYQGCSIGPTGSEGRVMLGEVIRIYPDQWFFFPAVRKPGEFFHGLTRSDAVNACMKFY